VVKILRAHLSQPSNYDKSPNDSDNTMLVSTACAFDRMRNAARAAGVTLTINSGQGIKQTTKNTHRNSEQCARRQMKRRVSGAVLLMSFPFPLFFLCSFVSILCSLS
jgi:hypothetical protein